MLKYPAIFVIFVIGFVLFISYLSKQFYGLVVTPSNIKYGVSFSPNLVTYMGLDWKKVYLSLMDDLHVKYIRVPSFWESISPEPSQFDFSQTDFMVDEASKRGVKVLFVVGLKQPRWPECHIPTWARNLSVANRQKAAIPYIQKTVQHYLYNSAIWGWQVENEPLFSFGEGCDKKDKNFLRQEVSAVKTIDSSRPVIITDSGEWQPWISAMQLSDILGISVYTKAYHHIFGYITYPFPGFTYSFKSNLVRSLFASKNQKTIITELQSEPWVQGGFLDVSIPDQIELFSLDDFKSNIKLGQNIGFDEAYLWGAEWWYFMKEHDHPEYWDYAKTLFNP